MPESAITITGIKKRFGTLEALKGIDLEVPKGKLLGLLGPNGAGKTTLIRILTTLMTADEGTAFVGGFDVARDPEHVRETIGLAGQYAAVDEILTGRENLLMVGRLYHMTLEVAAARADELLEQFNLTDAADRQLKTYSGGMRRRLDLALSLVNRPPILFLDEPTTGLDPGSRLALWDIIRDLVKKGTTVLLTTQYLEEADSLADSIVVIDHGKVIAQGTQADLKKLVGGSVLEIRIGDQSRFFTAIEALKGLGNGTPILDPATGLITIPIEEGAKIL
ncbi:ATP-binding cassette domain-containing protein, partial [Candidatus Parcubacteria bacterium]|nr:ATP-binding cassette domain-containing protein [Candidatus Parcubacteria bacterium]